MILFINHDLPGNHTDTLIAVATTLLSSKSHIPHQTPNTHQPPLPANGEYFILGSPPTLSKPVLGASSQLSSSSTRRQQSRLLLMHFSFGTHRRLSTNKRFTTDDKTIALEMTRRPDDPTYFHSALLFCSI